MKFAHCDVTLLEELNFNAWPALATVHFDGWLLRSSGGESRRVNSVNPLTAGRLGLDQKIASAEATYRRWGRPTVFRMTPLADDGLDEALAARGYAIAAPTFVQTAPLAPLIAGDGVRVFARPQRAWIDAAIGLRGLGGEAADVFARQHGAVGIEARWALVLREGLPAAVGVVAIERGWAGLHGIYVASSARRHGLGRQISHALMGHGQQLGAHRAWLQVEQRNAPALRLYQRLGFTTAYGYHHRIIP